MKEKKKYKRKILKVKNSKHKIKNEIIKKIKNLKSKNKMKQYNKKTNKK